MRNTIHVLTQPCTHVHTSPPGKHCKAHIARFRVDATFTPSHVAAGVKPVPFVKFHPYSRSGRVT